LGELNSSGMPPFNPVGAGGGGYQLSGAAF